LVLAAFIVATVALRFAVAVSGSAPLGWAATVVTAVTLGLCLRAALPDRSQHVSLLVVAAAIAQAVALAAQAPTTPGAFAVNGGQLVGAIAALGGYSTLVWLGRDTTKPNTPLTSPALTVAGIGFVAVVAMLIATTMLGVGAAPDVVLIAAGTAALATSRRRGVLGAAAVAVLADPVSSVEALVTAGGALVWVIVVVLGRLVAVFDAGRAASQPAATRTSTALRDLMLVNALNVVDAGVTWLLLDRGTGIELNPVINMIGLPAKVVLVAAGSIIIYRVRPRALPLLALPLAAVVAYHSFGIAVFGA